MFKSRKFFLAVMTLLVASGLVALKAIDSVAWSTAVIAVIGGYMGSNVWQKSVEAKPTGQI